MCCFFGGGRERGQWRLTVECGLPGRVLARVCVRSPPKLVNSSCHRLPARFRILEIQTPPELQILFTAVSLYCQVTNEMSKLSQECLTSHLSLCLFLGPRGPLGTPLSTSTYVRSLSDVITRFSIADSKVITRFSKHVSIIDSI